MTLVASTALVTAVGISLVPQGPAGADTAAGATATTSAGPSTSPVAPATPPTDATSKPDSASAVLTAHTYGHRVEDVSKSTPYSNTYANPDGSFTEEASPVPFQTQSSDGSWQPIDTDLTTTPDGTLAPKNTLNDVTFSDGGDTTVASMSVDGQHLGWDWASKLPTPTISGPTATYQITSTEQLVLTATASGFSEDIVLSAPPTSQAAADFTLPIETGSDTIATDGTSTDHGAVVSDASGKNLLWAAPPTAYDSAKPNSPEGGPSSAPVDLGAGVYDAGSAPAANGGGTAGTPGQVGSGSGKVGISLAPDWSWLTSPSTVYPVTIDPSFSSLTSGDTWVNSANTTTNENGNASLQVGDNTAQGWVARAFMHFDYVGMDQIQDMDVTSATLQLRNTNANSCTSAAINAQRVSADWNANTLTWANQPAVAADTTSFSPAYGYSSACPANNATWDVTGIVKQWASGANDNYGIRLAANTETNANSWRVYRAQEYGTTSDEPQLIINYTDPTPTFSASPGGTGYTTSLTPTLSASMATAPVASNVVFTLTDTEGDDPLTYTVNDVAAGGTATVTIPGEELDAGETYAVTVSATADDGSGIAFGNTSASLSTDLYGASVPETSACADTCVATSLTNPLYSTSVDPGQTVLVDPDPSANLDFESIAMLYGNLTTNAAGSGSLWVYDGDYQQPVAATTAYTAGTTTQTISLVPADDGSITLYNSGTTTVTVSISANTEDTTEDTSDDDSSDPDVWTPAMVCVTASDCPNSDAGGSKIPGKRVIDASTNPGYADPNLRLDSDGNWWIYSTGNGFPEWQSGSPNSDYDSDGLSMYSSDGTALIPSWASTYAADGHYPNLWAPDVIQIGSQYIMYFAAYDTEFSTMCLGIATATSPLGPFNDTRKLFCSNGEGANGRWAAIDPTEYQKHNGTRYLIYKTTPQGNTTKPWIIKAIRLDSTGTSIPDDASAFRLHYSTSAMEAPSLYDHNGTLWMFTSREQFNTCGYYTDAWKSPGLSDHFRLAVPDLVSETTQPTSSTDTCGTGGADISQNGQYLAYHAWKGTTIGKGGTRVINVAKVGWHASNGYPYLEK